MNVHPESVDAICPWMLPVTAIEEAKVMTKESILLQLPSVCVIDKLGGL